MIPQPKLKTRRANGEGRVKQNLLLHEDGLLSRNPREMTMTYTSNVAFTKCGNAVGFTANGTVVHGKYLSKSKSWVVAFGEHASLTDARRQLFATERDAAAYAASMIDESKTAELAWW